MAAIPFMPFYVADYLADASHLTTFEHGAYLLLIMNYWQRGEALPADEQKLARIARVNLRQWRLMAPTIEAFFSVRGNSWHHNRINSELHKVRAKSLKAREAGLASVERRLNGTSTDVERTFNHTDTEADTDTEVVDDVDAREADPPWPADALDLTAEVCRAAGIRHCDPGHIRDRVPIVRQWLALGADPPLIRQTIGDLTSATTEPIRSLNYIDPHIRKAVIAKEQAANGHKLNGKHAPRQLGAATPSGRLGAALELLAEVRANADQPGNHGATG